MENILRDRVRARLEALDLNPFEAARRIPAERTFLNDLLIGKKDTIRRSAIPGVAAALDCDPGYLIGSQDAPRRADAGSPPQAPEIPSLAPATPVPLIGVAEAGTWRPWPVSGPPQSLPIHHDQRFPAADQVAFIVRGDHAADLGAADGSVILALSGGSYRDGDVVVIRRTRHGDDGAEAETSLRRYAHAMQLSPGSEIIARAISAHRVF